MPRNNLKSEILDTGLSPYLEVQSNILTNLRVGTIARVVSFDSNRGTITAQPLIRERVRLVSGDRKEADLPLIENVPVLFFAGNNVAPVVDDLCLLIHTDRNYQEVINNYDKNNPDTLRTYSQPGRRKHNLSDAVALVGLYSYAQAKDVVFT